ncbi:DNA polymerase eta [Leptinotarsa decemlineata]|uniref:DNA polymerase eta n=1 Tax=Leptinotarsa decemlineata TaxID=7539 RepID=UPI000C253142|nr:DNA polymerase eta-like [Leptinotarsa decemlineata]
MFIKMAHAHRVIVLIDMDCFYCQVEEKLNSSLKGKPIAVVQYNAWRGGGIIAVNYPARGMGVTRHMRGNEAKEKCPEIVLARVPQVRGKADLTKYREAGKRVAEVLQTFTLRLERASIDEAYLDITELVDRRKNDAESSGYLSIDRMKNTFVVGYDTQNFLENMELSESNFRLALGGVIVEEIREKVFIETGYECSAGIAHNKILAKLVCGLHKPNKQTILPQESVELLYKDLSVKKIKSLGGKFGDLLSEELQISNMGELIRFSEKELIKRFDEKNGKWLFNIARGIDLDPVTTRLVSKSIGCCKRFPGVNCLTTQDDVEHWLNELASEISERLEKDLEENNRRAKQMVISFAQKINKKEISSSRTHYLSCYDQRKIVQDSIEVVRKFCQNIDGSYKITFLGISVGNFQDTKSNMNITSFFKKVSPSQISSTDETFHGKIKNGISLENSASYSDAKFPFSSHQDESEIENEVNPIDKECDPENLSVYSASTDDLDEEPTNYICYEDIYPESVSKSPLSNSFEVTSNVHNESVFREINFLENSEEEDKSKISTQSFFNEYFEKSLESGVSMIEPKYSEDENRVNVSMPEETSDEIFQNVQSYTNCDERVCPKCSKQIEITEMQSHMDFHFALEIVKQEAHLYAPQKRLHIEKGVDIHKNKGKRKISPEVKSSLKGASSKTSLKRKVSNAKPISSFFAKSEKLNEENSKYCSDCDKRIPLPDFSIHTDYHVAKRIHVEMNVSLPQLKNGN